MISRCISIFLKKFADKYIFVGGDHWSPVFYSTETQIKRAVIDRPYNLYMQLHYTSAITSTSTSTPLGSSLTATQLLAGFDVKYSP